MLALAISLFVFSAFAKIQSCISTIISISDPHYGSSMLNCRKVAGPNNSKRHQSSMMPFSKMPNEVLKIDIYSFIIHCVTRPMTLRLPLLSVPLSDETK